MTKYKLLDPNEFTKVMTAIVTLGFQIIEFTNKISNNEKTELLELYSQTDRKHLVT